MIEEAVLDVRDGDARRMSGFIDAVEDQLEVRAPHFTVAEGVEGGASGYTSVERPERVFTLAGIDKSIDGRGQNIVCANLPNAFQERIGGAQISRFSVWKIDGSEGNSEFARRIAGDAQ